MDEIMAMKGRPRLIATVASSQATTKLVGFADGSYGVIQNDRFAGMWEPQEQGECFETFLSISGARSTLSAVVLRVGDGAARASVKPGQISPSGHVN
jgi:hypothetical protein